MNNVHVLKNGDPKLYDKYMTHGKMLTLLMHNFLKTKLDIRPLH